MSKKSKIIAVQKASITALHHTMKEASSKIKSSMSVKEMTLSGRKGSQKYFPARQICDPIYQEAKRVKQAAMKAPTRQQIDEVNGSKKEFDREKFTEIMQSAFNFE